MQTLTKHVAKRTECAELAPAFARKYVLTIEWKSGRKVEHRHRIHSLHTLREILCGIGYLVR